MSSWTPEAVEASRELATVLGQAPLMADAPPREPLGPGEFLVFSASEPGHMYRMVRTPEGVAIHQGEDCTGARFRGPFGCRHSKENSTMTTALVRAEAVLTPAPIAFNDSQMQVIANTICKGATPQELQLFVATCTRTGLDPFMRQIYAVKRYDSTTKGMVMAIQVGIDGMRLIAERTGKYAGQDAVEWLDTDGVWSEVWTGVGEFPVAARCSVYRKDWGERKATAVCRWDSYAQYFGNPAKLSPTWDKMPDVMLGKCAESLAIRKAFPAEMSAVAAAVDVNYDPAYDVEIQPEATVETFTPPVDAIEGEVIQPPAPITDAQRERLKRLITEINQTWDDESKAKVYATLRGTWGHAFTVNGNYASKLSEAEATAVIDYLDPQPEEPEYVAEEPDIEEPVQAPLS